LFERKWGKMPYPKFLETESCVVRRDGDEIWSGMCYFVYRGRAVAARDGVHEEVNGRVTMDADLACAIGRAGDGDVEFFVGGRRFGMVDFRPFYNPDGSFHHVTFNLLERRE